MNAFDIVRVHSAISFGRFSLPFPLFRFSRINFQLKSNAIDRHCYDNQLIVCVCLCLSRLCKRQKAKREKRFSSRSRCEFISSLRCKRFTIMKPSDSITTIYEIWCWDRISGSSQFVDEWLQNPSHDTWAPISACTTYSKCEVIRGRPRVACECVTQTFDSLKWKWLEEDENRAKMSLNALIINNL